MASAPQDGFLTTSHTARRSNQDLREMMQRRRDLCAEFESAPSATTAEPAADASASTSDAGFCRASAKHSDCGRGKAKTSAEELDSWMARMRGRCFVLESTPAPAVADVLWSDGSSAVGPGLVLESVPTACAADASSGVALAERVVGSTGEVARAIQQSSTSSAHTPHVQESWGARVRGGWPLPSASRVQVWTEQMQVKMLQSEVPEDHCALIAVPLLVLLLKATVSEGTIAEDGLLPLAVAFSDRHFGWLAARNLWGILSQLLRYHCPRVVGCLVEACGTDSSDLASALDVACGGPQGLVELLFTSGATAHEKEGTLLLCDRLVVESRDMLLLFVVVALVVEAADSLEHAGSLEQAMDWIRNDALRRLGSCGIQGARRCLDHACRLYESTPLSFLSSLALGCSSSTCSDLPMCTIAPHEVLTHVFETPASAWRLVVVDVRRQTDGFALPVCMRLSAQQDRRAILQDLPDENSIHVCLLGDAPPSPGEEAFELCSFMMGAPGFRKHISVAAGGWPEVAELANALGLELFPLEVEENEITKSEVDRSVGQQARAAVVAVTETAAAAGMGAARRVLAGFGFTSE